MPRMIYLTQVRFPTEKAHGLQIAQNCEAFADAGYDVELWVAQRFNTPDMRQITDSHAHYGIEKNFTIHNIPCLDLYPLAFGNTRLEQLAFYIQVATFTLMAFIMLLFRQVDVIYSRDEYVLLGISALLPRKKLAYEAHLYLDGRFTKRIQRMVVQRVGSVIAITPKLREDLIAERGANPQNVLVAHDGVRAKRFANLPSKADARQQIGWDADVFIVGFVGRLHMIGQDKGIGTLIDAMAQCDDVALALVGGPDAMAEQYRQQWLKLGLPETHFLYAGQVAPDAVPLYLRAFDVSAMPHPFTKQFAYYTSPLKLFEYMAAGRAIIASDLPAWADVVTHEQDALLVPPQDVTSLAEAIKRLQQDSALRSRLGTAAQEHVMQHYTWDARANHIKAHLERAIMSKTSSNTGVV